MKINYPTNEVTKAFCSYGFKKTSMDSHKDAAACYELKIPKIHHTATIAVFLLLVHSKNRVLPVTLQQLQ